MSVEDSIKNALDGAFIGYQQVVEVDPVESDYLITGVKQLPKKDIKEKGMAESQTLKNSHGGYEGKSIIQRLEALADSDFRRYMKSGREGDGRNEDGLEAVKYLDARVEGICECLALMKNTLRNLEYEAVVVRYQRWVVQGV